MTATIDSKDNGIFCKGCLREIVTNEENGVRVPCPICGSTHRDVRHKIVSYMKIVGG